jgi:predicted membrane-bound spermidine synthase
LDGRFTDTSRAILTLAFVLSGAAGLIYESIWTRYLGLFVGHSAYAQVIVLVIFMGGMAIGALIVGRRSERLTDPLRAYAVVEAVVGVLGLLFHPAFVGLTGLAYEVWFPALGASPAVGVLKWALSALMILPQSVLLGATFPLMSAGVVRRLSKAPGGTVALLYFANSLGGAVGVLVAGFWLIGAVGLPGTLAAAAGINLLVAATVGALARRSSRQPGQAIAPWRPATEVANPFAGLVRLLIVVSFGTAAASFIYEIAWVRMLSLVLASATHSFELMLSAFIFGLAMGSAWIRTRADGLAQPMRFLGWTQWIMGALALATLPLYSASFDWMAGLVTSLTRAPQGYEIFSVSRYGICLAVMLPATFCAGITLPLLTLILMTRGSGEGAIGAIYGANTLGSILGAMLAGLVLMPWLGLERLLTAGAAIDMALGIALLASASRVEGDGSLKRTGNVGRATWAAAVAGLAIVVGVAGLARIDRLRLASAPYRSGRVLRRSESQVLFYRDGRTATVNVRRDSLGTLTLSTNGKPDASVAARWLHPLLGRAMVPLNDDESTQLLLGVVTLAYAPRARNAAVVGIGSGMTSHVLLGSPRLASVLTVEIEPEMIAGAHLFLPANRRVFSDPRSTIVVDDARSFFAASPERFDLIVSEPSNPWVSGVAGLFTDEFYRRVSHSLTAQGVLGQWLHLYDLEDDLSLSVLAAVARNFRWFTIHLVSGTDILIVASNGPTAPSPHWEVVSDPGIVEDFRHTLPFTPPIFDATWVADRQSLAPLLERVRVNSDFQPVLDLGAERARFRQRQASGLILLHTDRLMLTSAGAPRVEPLPDFVLPLAGVPRVYALMRLARLRAMIAGESAAADAPAEERRWLAEALERSRRVRAPAETGQPSADWSAWFTDATRASNDLHGGTTGYADAKHFESLRRAAAMSSAPPSMRPGIEWLEATERRDFARASALSDTLLAELQAGRGWIPPGILLEGGVTAKLATGDLVGARRLVHALTGGQPLGEALGARVIEAHLASRP